MTILLADDHPFTLQGTKSFVESYGYKVTDTCSNGVSALNLILLHLPDIAILDINMPGLDGLEVAKKVHEAKIITKVILLTMHKEMTIYKKASQYGIFGYILKEHAQTELEHCLLAVKKGDKYISSFLEDDLIASADANLGELSTLSFAEKKNFRTSCTTKNQQTNCPFVILIRKNRRRTPQQNH